MHTYILLSGLVFLSFGMWFSTNGIANCTVKTIFLSGAIWSAYLLFGPSNLIAFLEK